MTAISPSGSGGRASRSPAKSWLARSRAATASFRLCGILWLAIPFSAFAQGVATDNAGESAYDDGWDSADNGGTGWQGWTFSSYGSAGAFVGTSQSNGFMNGDIDAGGRAWGLWANDGGFSAASRVYGDGTELFGPGTTISVDMDTGFIDEGSQVGFSVIGTGDSRTYGNISVSFTGGGTNYVVSQGSWYWVTTYDTGIPYDSQGLHVEIDIGETNDFTCRLTPAGGATVTIAGNAQAGNLHVLELYNRNAGAGSTNDAFFNNIAVLPPPRITDYANANGTNLTISLLPRAGLNNVLQRCDDLEIGIWEPVASNLTGNGMDVLQVTDTVPAGDVQRFYRVRAEP